MAIPYGLLVAGMNYSNVAEDEFNDWYDTEHIPERKRIKGFLGAERWVNAEELSSMPGLGGSGGGSKISIALYDLESLDVLQSPAYLAIAGNNLSPWSKRMMGKYQRVCRFEAEQTLPGRQPGPADAGGLMLFGMNVLPEVEADFNAWFDQEHIPNLAAVPGVLAARRFKMASGTHRYLVLYHLTTPEVQATKEWKQGGASPWTDRMKPHFLAPERNPLRLVMRRYVRKA